MEADISLFKVIKSRPKRGLILWIFLLPALIVAGQDYKTCMGLARDFFKNGQYPEAAQICEKCLPIVREAYGDHDTAYLNLEAMAADCFRYSAQYRKALQIYADLNTIRSNDSVNHPAAFAWILSNLADCYYNMGEYDTALPLYEKARSIRLLAVGSRHPDYARSLSDLGTLYYVKGNFKKALPFFEEALAIDRDSLGKHHPRYADDIGNLAMTEKKLGNFDDALPLLKEACIISKEVSGAKHPDYASALSNLAGLYISTGNYEAALPLYEDVKDIRLEVLGAMHPDYARALSNLGFLYIRMGNYEAALPLYKEAKSIRKEVLGAKHPDYATSLNNLASLYRRLGNYKAALPVYKEASEIYRESLGNKHPDYATSLGNQAMLYTEMGNYEAALPLYLQATAIDKEALGAENPDYAADLLNLANLYYAIGEDTTALALSEEASVIYKKALGSHNPDYALSLNSLARLYQSMGDYSASLPLLLESSSIYEQDPDTKNVGYAKTLRNLARTYKETGNYEAALASLLKATDIYRRVLGQRHPEYAISLNNLAGVYIAMGNYQAAMPLLEETNSIINRNIQENFSFISEEEKEKYFDLVANNYQVFLSFLLKVSSISPEYCRQGYDNELLIKGLILTSVKTMQQCILSCGDTALIREYEKMRMLRRQINSWQQKPVAERRADIGNIEKQATELEKDLTVRSQSFGAMQASFLIRWEDVKKQLKANEAAVEFVSFRYYNDRKATDSTLYCALVLKHDDTAPHVVYLCEEAALKKATPAFGASYTYINEMYRKKKLYDLLWHPLDSLFRNINTIYYAPAGLMNSISMAAITCNDSSLLMDKYNLVRLTSTRSLALREKEGHIRNAVVYGGIIYDTDTLTLLQKARKYHSTDDYPLAHNRSGSADMRNGFRYLEGTMKEAGMISAKLRNKGIETKMLSGTEANEESFFALSGENAPSLIHMSTHGFYYPEQQGKKNKINASEAGEPLFMHSDDPLIRSGLLMSGANISWKGSILPPGVEDGILTAKEVSNMNLIRTQLVVLSACQTGQGDVKGSEGVEGLQRGFKMAGAKYIMMSLWEVPDRETAEFMDTFYDKWLSGLDIHEAFKATQLFMSNKYKNDPFRWAAFVLAE